MMIKSSRPITGSIQAKTTKKGNTYLYMVLVIHNEDGSHFTKWESTHLEARGNMRKAQKMLEDRLYELNKTLFSVMAEDTKPSIKARDIFFVDWMKDYCDEVRLTIRASTAEVYQNRVEKIEKYFGPKKYTLADLTTKIFSEYFRYEQEYGKVSQKDGSKSPLAVSTVRSIKTLCVSALNKAVELGYLDRNPVESIRIGNKSNRELKRKFNYMKVEELNKLFQFLKDDEMIDIVKAISYFGLRRSEALGITLSPNSLDMENRQLTISRTIVKQFTKHDEENTKTNKSYRNFYLTDEMLNFFQKVLDKKEADRKFFGNTYKESPFLFTWPDGVPFEPDYLYHHFKKLMTQYGKPQFTLHSLRHSCANFLYKNGWRESEIADWLGNSEETMREWYLVLERNHNKEKAKSLSGVLKI